MTSPLKTNLTPTFIFKGVDAKQSQSQRQREVTAFAKYLYRDYGHTNPSQVIFNIHSMFVRTVRVISQLENCSSVGIMTHMFSSCEFKLTSQLLTCTYQALTG